MSTMTEAAQQYLRLRRSLGYKLEVPGRLVLSFAGHLDALGIAHVTADAAAEWATAPRNAKPYWHWLRMSAVRGFAVYLHSLDSRHQVPPSDMLPRQYTRPAPYLFSDDEIAALIQAAGRMRHGPGVTATYQTLIGLLAVTGCGQAKPAAWTGSTSARATGPSRSSAASTASRASCSWTRPR